jgi:CrcB protein
MIWTVLQVAIGGALGAVGRYLTGLAAARFLGAGYPWGTLTVNVVGSFAIGVLFIALMAKDASRLSPFLLTGVLGGFTTFSAFSLDALKLFEKGQPGLAAGYILASVVFSLLAVFLGVIVAREIWA